MAGWLHSPRSGNRKDGPFDPDTIEFPQRGTMNSHAVSSGNGQLSNSLDLEGVGLGLMPSHPTSLGGCVGFDFGSNTHHQQQPPPLPLAPPLPPSFPCLRPHTEDIGAFYHLQHQQQFYQQQAFTIGPVSSSGLSSLAFLGGMESNEQHRMSFEPASLPLAHGSARHLDGKIGETSVSDRPSCSLSDAMFSLNLDGEMPGNSIEPVGFRGEGGWGHTSSKPPSALSSSASLRDQMNAQMAALYQHPVPLNNDRIFSQSLLHQRQPLPQSDHNLLNGRTDDNHSNYAGFPERELKVLPNIHTVSGNMQSRAPGRISHIPASSLSHMSGHGDLAPIMSPTGKPDMRSVTPSHTRRSPAKSSRWSCENSVTSLLAGSPNNSIHVLPEVTKPNENIKVQVSLLAEECVVGRVLLVGLFRLGQSTNDKPTFVKQVLFENKLHRNYRYLNTRITFHAPRSPGDFEFRVFEDESGHQLHSKRQSHSTDDHYESHRVSYSNVIIARSNRLKVCLEYSHFIDTLRATYDKFKQGVVEGDAGLVLSALLALTRLVDQVETKFFHGHALFGDMLEACLRLLKCHADDITQSFTATETIPHPIETFHGMLRNVLNAVEANKYVRELVFDSQLAEIARIQRERYCQVSGLYFASDGDRYAFWLKHFGFEPIEKTLLGSHNDSKGKMLATGPFVTRVVTRWVEREAAILMPNRAAFHALRQSIYDQVHAEVISKLPFTCELDVFGSSANEFGNEQSDMDMCLVLPEASTPTVEEKQRMLRKVVVRLESRPDLFTSVDTTRLTARIPIVMFVSRTFGIECDLCIENRLAQRNTSLLRAYASADPRVRILAYVIKQFVKQRRMNCAAEGTLSSYGYLLLLIHFLQRQDPPVLPVLQALPPNWPNEPREELPSVVCRGPSDELVPSSSNGSKGPGGIETYFFDPFAFRDSSKKLASLRNYCARNTQTVGELLLGFLHYFGLQFDASRDVVSIRHPDAGIVTKNEKRHSAQWRFSTRLSIEDPFEIGYDVAHVLKDSRDKYIRQQFVRAYVLLMNGAIRHESKAERNVNINEQHAEAADDAVERIMSIINEHVLEVPFMQAPSQPNLTCTDADTAAT